MNQSIDTKKLRMFVTTVNEGSMRKASAMLFVTPSALSHGIKSLEESLDTQLFTRNGPVLSATAEGHKFYSEAVDILSRLDGVVSRFVNKNDGEHIQLRIGTTNTGCSYLFSGIVREFRESFPNVSIKLDVADTDQLLSRLHGRQIDIAIAPIERDYRDLEQIELGFDELVYIVHPVHEWARQKKVGNGNLTEEKLITPAIESHTYKLIDSFYRGLRIPFEPFIELNNEDAIKQLVTLNIGVGVVPKWIAKKEIESGKLVAFPLGERPLRRRWTVSHRAKIEPSFPEFLFIKTAESLARNVLGSVSFASA